jgi:hypothetical protein
MLRRGRLAPSISPRLVRPGDTLRIGFTEVRVFRCLPAMERPFEVDNEMCREIDTPEDYASLEVKLKNGGEDLIPGRNT